MGQREENEKEPLKEARRGNSEHATRSCKLTENAPMNSKYRGKED